MHPSPQYLRPVPLRRGVVEAQNEARRIGHQRLDEFEQQPGGDPLGPMPDGGRGGIAPAVLAR